MIVSSPDLKPIIKNSLQTIIVKSQPLIILTGKTSFDVHDVTELPPEEYLKFAREDILSDSSRGLINSVTNAKRAIDCQIDNFIYLLGYLNKDFNLIHTELIKKLASHCLHKEIKKLNKLDFLLALDIAPTNLIAEMRRLRNKAEHQYTIPLKKEAQNIIDLAYFLIRTIKTIQFYDGFQISIEKNNEVFNKRIYIQYDSGNYHQPSPPSAVTNPTQS